jgi:hypothetical protein
MIQDDDGRPRLDESARTLGARPLLDVARPSIRSCDFNPAGRGPAQLEVVP